MIEASDQREGKEEAQIEEEAEIIEYGDADMQEAIFRFQQEVRPLARL